MKLGAACVTVASELRIHQPFILTKMLITIFCSVYENAGEKNDSFIFLNTELIVKPNMLHSITFRVAYMGLTKRKNP